MTTSRIPATYLAGQVLSFEQRHTCLSTDFSHGLGEMLTSQAAKLPPGLANLSFSESIFTLTQELGYNFGAVTQLLNETDRRFNTGGMRNIYSPDVLTVSELVVDRSEVRLRDQRLQGLHLARQRHGLQPLLGARRRHRVGRRGDDHRGLADTVDGDLHPMQEAWLEYDVAQCGYCQPGQIMAAVAKVEQARAEGHEITDADLDEIRNVCRCGTHSRIREAIKAGSTKMWQRRSRPPGHGLRRCRTCRRRRSRRR